MRVPVHTPFKVRTNRENQLFREYCELDLFLASVAMHTVYVNSCCLYTWLMRTISSGVVFVFHWFSKPFALNAIKVPHICGNPSFLIRNEFVALNASGWWESCAPRRTHSVIRQKEQTMGKNSSIESITRQEIEQQMKLKFNLFDRNPSDCMPVMENRLMFERIRNSLFLSHLPN